MVSCGEKQREGGGRSTFYQTGKPEVVGSAAQKMTTAVMAQSPWSPGDMEG